MISSGRLERTRRSAAHRRGRRRARGEFSTGLPALVGHSSRSRARIRLGTRRGRVGRSSLTAGITCSLLPISGALTRRPTAAAVVVLAWRGSRPARRRGRARGHRNRASLRHRRDADRGALPAGERMPPSGGLRYIVASHADRHFAAADSLACDHDAGTRRPHHAEPGARRGTNRQSVAPAAGLRVLPSMRGTASSEPLRSPVMLMAGRSTRCSCHPFGLNSRAGSTAIRT